MNIKEKKQPTFFISSPTDLRELRKKVFEMFENLREQVASDKGIKAYAWEREVAESGFDQGRPAMEQIPLFKGRHCKAVACFFAERIGTQINNPDAYVKYLGGAEKIVAPGGEHLVPDWHPGDELKGGFALTGTVFELLVVLAANERAAESKQETIPLKVLFIGDESLFDDTSAEHANWGMRSLYRQKHSYYDKKNQLGKFHKWFEEEYNPQIMQLKNLIVYLRHRHVQLDEYALAKDFNEAVKKCRAFLLKRLGYRLKQGDINPFKGLEFYDEGDVEIFFGRNAWLDDAIRKFERYWMSPRAAPFYGIVGGSGVGKSSLLRAGLMPRLKDAVARGAYKGTVLTASELIITRGSERKAGGFSATPLGRVLKKCLMEFYQKPDIAKAMDWINTTVAAAQPTRAVDTLIKALDECAKNETQDEVRFVIGLDQFEELMDYRVSEDGGPDLDALFHFFQLACDSRRIGFLYTCQTNRLSLLALDPVLASLAKSKQQKDVFFLSEESIKEVTRKNFEKSSVDLSEEIVDELYQRVNKFAEKIEQAGSRDGKFEELRATLLPLFSLTLLRIYEHCRELKDKLKQERIKEARNSFRKAEQLQDSGESAEITSPASRTYLRDDGMLALELEGIPEELLDVEGAITELADKAIKEVRESPNVNWSDDVLDILLRRLVRIQSAREDRFNLTQISTPRRGAGKIFVDTFRMYRLLIPAGPDKIRLVHEAIISHWPPARKWLENERELLFASENLTALANAWEKLGRPLSGVLQLQLIGKEQLDFAGKLLRNWQHVFDPRDGTQPRPEDQLLCDFAFAILEAAMTPGRVASETSDFLIAVTYGRKELVHRYLKVEPSAARNHKTLLNVGAAYFAAFADIATMNLVLENGADPTQSTLEGWQPIHAAANNGNIEILDRLVQAGADPISAGPSGRTALHLAAVNDDPHMLRHLLEAYGMHPSLPDEQGWTPLLAACRYKSSKAVKVLLNHRAIDTSLTTKDGWSALHLVCQYGDAELVQLVLQSQLTDPTLKTSDGWSALHRAVFSKSPDIVIALLQDERVDRDAETPTRKSPVEFAIHEGGLDILAALLSDPFGRVDPDASVGKISTPLIKACLDGKLDLVRVLVEGGADVNRVAKFGKRSAFLATAERGDIEVLKLLLPKADFFQSDHEGRNALHLAALSGNAFAVEELLNFIDPQLRDTSGSNPIHLAAKAGYLKSVRAFLEFNDEMLDFADGLGRRLPHIAAAQGHLDLLLEFIELSGVWAEDAQGMTALHYSARFGKADIVKHLLEEERMDPNSRDYYGWTPLHLSAQNGHLDVVKVLLKNGASISVVGINPPLTPLQAAVATGQTAMVDLLIPQVQTRDDRFALLEEALFLTVKNAQFETAKTLLALQSTGEL